VEPVPLRVVTRDDAEQRDYAEKLPGAGLVYLSGGVPPYLVETLRGTRLWRAIREAWQAGTALAGCSAGAMALGALALDPRGRAPVPGLGVVPHVAVLPHFDRFERFRPRMASELFPLRPAGVHLVGIDEDTTVVGGPEEWTVHGRGGAWVLSPDGGRRGAHAGETLHLPLNHRG
jgi:cyanophycinase-like exopeptidase